MFRVPLSFLLCLFFLESVEAKVKKPITYTATSLATSFAVPRTYDFTPRTTIGFEGGMGLGQTAVTEGGAIAGETSTRQTFGGGLYFDLPLSRYFTISPELLYLSKGVNAGKIEFRFDFIEFPVLTKLHFMTGDFRPYVFAGPGVGIPLSKQKFAADGTSTDIDGGGLVDLSVQLGLGTEIDLGGNVGLVFSGRYIHGFVDQTTDPNQTLYNRTFLFMAGFRVGL